MNIFKKYQTKFKYLLLVVLTTLLVSPLITTWRTLFTNNQINSEQIVHSAGLFDFLGKHGFEGYYLQPYMDIGNHAVRTNVVLTSHNYKATNSAFEEFTDSQIDSYGLSKQSGINADSSDASVFGGHLKYGGSHGIGENVPVQASQWLKGVGGGHFISPTVDSVATNNKAKKQSGLPAPSIDGDSTRFIFTFPGNAGSRKTFGGKDRDTSHHNATDSDSKKANNIAQGVVADYNQALEIAYQRQFGNKSDDSSNAKDNINNHQLAVMMQDVANSADRNAAGNRSQIYGGLDAEYVYYTSKNSHKRSAGAYPKASYNGNYYIRLYNKNKSVDNVFIYAQPKGYLPPDTNRGDGGNDYKVSLNDGTTGTDIDQRYISWKNIALQTIAANLYSGKSVNDMDSASTNSKIEDTINGWIEGLLTSLERLLHLTKISDLVFNKAQDGLFARNDDDTSSIVPDNILNAANILMWAGTAIGSFFIILALANLLAKQSGKLAFLSDDATNNVIEFKNKLVQIVLLGLCIYLEILGISYLCQLNNSIVDALRQWATNAGNGWNMVDHLTLNGYSGGALNNIGLVLVQFIIFGFTVYYNIFYLERIFNYLALIFIMPITFGYSAIFDSSYRYTSPMRALKQLCGVIFIQSAQAFILTIFALIFYQVAGFGKFMLPIVILIVMGKLSQVIIELFGADASFTHRSSLQEALAGAGAGVAGVLSAFNGNRNNRGPINAVHHNPNGYNSGTAISDTPEIIQPNPGDASAYGNTFGNGGMESLRPLQTKSNIEDNVEEPKTTKPIANGLTNGRGLHGQTTGTSNNKGDSSTIGAHEYQPKHNAPSKFDEARQQIVADAQQAKAQAHNPLQGHTLANGARRVGSAVLRGAGAGVLGAATGAELGYAMAGGGHMDRHIPSLLAAPFMKGAHSLDQARQLSSAQSQNQLDRIGSQNAASAQSIPGDWQGSYSQPAADGTVSERFDNAQAGVIDANTNAQNNTTTVDYDTAAIAGTQEGEVLIGAAEHGITPQQSASGLVDVKMSKDGEILRATYDNSAAGIAGVIKSGAVGTNNQEIGFQRRINTAGVMPQQMAKSVGSYAVAGHGAQSLPQAGRSAFANQNSTISGHVPAQHYSHFAAQGQTGATQSTAQTLLKRQSAVSGMSLSQDGRVLTSTIEKAALQNMDSGYQHSVQNLVNGNQDHNSNFIKATDNGDAYTIDMKNDANGALQKAFVSNGEQNMVFTDTDDKLAVEQEFNQFGALMDSGMGNDSLNGGVTTDATVTSGGNSDIINEFDPSTEDVLNPLADTSKPLSLTEGGQAVDSGQQNDAVMEDLISNMEQNQHQHDQ